MPTSVRGARSEGLRELPGGAPLAYVPAAKVPVPQVALGADLDHSLVTLEHAASASALEESMQRQGARYLLLPDPLTPGAVETEAVRNRLRFRGGSPPAG